MRWAVKVDVLGENERLVEETLASLNVRLVRDGDDVLLESEVFERFEDVPSVREAARKVCDTLANLAALRPEFDIELRLGAIVVERVEGAPVRRHAHIEVRPAIVRVRAQKVEITRGHSSEEERVRFEAERKEREFQTLRNEASAYARACLADSKCIDVLRLLDGDISIQDLNHVVEIIRHDLGGDIFEIVSRKQLERFDRSINHPGVFGLDARHAVSSHQLPPKPMSMDEAIQFVGRLVDSWIKRKG